MSSSGSSVASVIDDFSAPCPSWFVINNPSLMFLFRFYRPRILSFNNQYVNLSHYCLNFFKICLFFSSRLSLLLSMFHICIKSRSVRIFPKSFSWCRDPCCSRLLCWKAVFFFLVQSYLVYLSARSNYKFNEFQFLTPSSVIMFVLQL